MITAAVLRECGRSPVVEQHPEPRPGDGQVLIRVAAAPITPLDVLCATGTSYFGAPPTPYVPGVQGVGHLPDGTAVWFATSAGMRPGSGSMAAAVAVPEADVVPLPPGAPLELTAALGLSAVAAHEALHTAGDPAGKRIVVLGAGGVVGQSAVQLARLAGASHVIAVARSADALARATELGATATVPLGAALDGPVDLVIDPVFGAPAAAALRALRPGGILVNLGSAAGATAPIDSAVLRGGSLRIVGYTNNSLTVERRASVLTKIAGLAAAGRLTVTHRRVPVSSVSNAWTAPGRTMLTF
ncbi:quinone oxidoreductase family protein [Symbioplanes lichenis]|uniref:quinone oxidoreductase family protein n=1 Tax=Symbioplanes lichenis TaxID=1629072 RepID=UPI002739EB2A|nr:zinc-binding alcohol dehydrogenase family protein [Actinoplanes lichenis]